MPAIKTGVAVGAGLGTFPKPCVAVAPLPGPETGVTVGGTGMVVCARGGVPVTCPTVVLNGGVAPKIGALESALGSVVCRAAVAVILARKAVNVTAAPMTRPTAAQAVRAVPAHAPRSAALRAPPLWGMPPLCFEPGQTKRCRVARVL